MKLKLKENPKEWRKAAWMPLPGLAVLAFLLHWRRILPSAGAGFVLIVLTIVAVAAGSCPRWFRGYYRVSTTVGFHLSRWAGRAILTVFFFCILTPVGLLLRAFGKDSLLLRRPANTGSYWKKVRPESPLDRLF